MTTYTVSTKAEHAKFTVLAEDYDSAALIAGRKLNGRRASLTARRTTGESGKSGWFQSYYWDRLANGLNSTGQPFHIM